MSLGVSFILSLFYMFSNEIWIIDQTFQEYDVSHANFLYLPEPSCVIEALDLKKTDFECFSIKCCGLKVVMHHLF